MSVPHELILTATALAIELVSVDTDDASDAGSIRLTLRIPEGSVAYGALPLIFVLGVMSFDEARPAGSSEESFEPDDQWTVDDMVEHLRFEDASLHFYADYVRGRRMKTSVIVDPEGIVEMEVVDRGHTARKWIDMLRRKQAAPAAGDIVSFYAASGEGLATWEAWQASHPALHWKEGRSAMLLARAWGEADGFPPNVRAALDRENKLRGLVFGRGLVEHETLPPGKGAASHTDLMVFAQDALGNPVVVAVEAKVDEGFDQPIAKWLTQGRSANSAENRKSRLEAMLGALEIDPAHPGVGALRYQLVHRAWAAFRVADDTYGCRAVLLVHSFLEPNERSGWTDFQHFARVVRVGSDEAIQVGVPFFARRLDGVELWLLWVAEP